MALRRRTFLQDAAAALGAAATLPAALAAADDGAAGSPDAVAAKSDAAWLKNARLFGDRFIEWQAPYGGPHPQRSPYRSAWTGTVVQGVGPQVRALYRLFEETGDERYKTAADRHAVFMLSTIHDPWEPYSSMIATGSKPPQFALSAAWIYGKAFSPCYEWFVRHNPQDPSLELKAYAMYRWLQHHRRDDSYYGVGYGIPGFEDAQFSCDLGEVGGGLVGFYKASGHQPALDDVFGLAKFFLTEHEPGSGRGVWSTERGTWLVGPWPGGGSEHFTDQQYNEVGWGWSCLVDGEFLLELRKLADKPEQADLRQDIAEKCVRAFRWCIDECQFEDGAHGMFGRDDKWVGQTAAAILLYAKLREQDLVPADVEAEYGPKIRQSWQWLLAHTGVETFPEHGYIKVTGATTPSPPENLLWMMAWTTEALLAGGKLFAKGA
jgi:hypothetical protein